MSGIETGSQGDSADRLIVSGRVKGVRVDGPSSFRSLEPCIKEMVGRWTFPQSYEEYGTEFSYLFQGNE